jgi:hypothetical protein
MPCWTIHLGIAKKLNEELNLNEDLFYYGNILPDVTKTNTYTRRKSHYYDKARHSLCLEEEIIELNRFIDTYKDNLTNPLILGYYTHLLTDYYYNNQIYTRSFIPDNNGIVTGIRLFNNEIITLEDNSRSARREFKQKDFLNYGKYLYKNNLITLPKDKKIIINNLKYLKPNFITKEEVIERIDYLNSNDFIEYNSNYDESLYKLFTKEEYDTIFNDCLSFIKKELNEKINIAF